MNIDINIILVQAIQLPVVALIILFCLNPRITNAISDNTYSNSNFIGNKAIKSKPLVFIAWGFIFNLLYLIVNILQSNQLPGILTARIGMFLSIGFEVLTVVFFLAEFIIFTFIDDRHFNSQRTKKSRFVIFVCASVLFLYLDLRELEFENFGLPAFECLIYGLISFYLYRKLQIVQGKQNVFAFAGSILWAALQTLTFIARHYHIDGRKIELLGFSISTISKILIFFGLYLFSLKIVKNALKKQQEKNDELNKKVKSINALPDLINSISNSKSLDGIAGKIVRHLTDRRVFDFDYVIFSEINSLNQKIIFKDAKALNPNIKDVRDWVLKEGISTDHHDIMAMVVKERKTIQACGPELFYEENNERIPIDINAPHSPLNKEVYTKYGHRDLDRFFIPVLHRENMFTDEPETTAKESRVVAIIEAGYYKDSALTHSKRSLSPKGELNLYLDNCSQAFERLFDEQMEDITDGIIRKSDTISKDDHTEYIKSVTKLLSETLNTDYVFAALYSVNKDAADADVIFPDNTLSDNNKEEAAKYVQHYIKGIAQDGSGLQCARAEAEIQNMFDSSSVHVTRLKIDEYRMGLIFFLSPYPDFFNDSIKSLIARATAEIPGTYSEKRFHNSLATLVMPDNAINDLEMNMKPLIHILSNYFDTVYISICLEDDDGSFIQKYATHEFKESCKKFGNEKFTGNFIDFEEEYSVISLQGKTGKNIEEVPIQNAEKRGFRRLLRKPVRTAHQNFGFINIYFKNEINVFSYEDISFLNLVAVKVLISMQIHGMMNAFREISDSFTRNDLKKTLKAITDSALTLLNADPVILFKSNNGKDVFFKDASCSNIQGFYNQRIVKLMNSKDELHVELAELILVNKSMFFNNHAEYDSFLRRHSESHEPAHFKDRFWDLEKIKSLAAVRLVNTIGNDTRPVGVMFINFRNEVVFTEETRRIIETFASFASSSIYNGFVFESNRQFLLNNLRLAKPILAEALTAGALHDVKKEFSAIYFFYDRLLQKIDHSFEYGNKKMDKNDIVAELVKLREPMMELDRGFVKIEALYKPEKVTYISKDVDIVKLVNSQLDIVSAEFFQERIDIQREFSEEKILIECDESQIGSALLNILKNAYQAMSNRGTLIVRIKTAGEKVRIEVVDNGSGISEDIKGFIFETYITNKEGGSGLGLPMSKYVIEAVHSGNITGVTKDGKTTFTITLFIKYPKKETNIE